MNAFEQTVNEIIASKGYWTQSSVKVELTKEEKERIGRKTTPRWEIDVVAYSPMRNELLAIECKSRLDSGGIARSALCDPDSRNAVLYKLFHNEELRKTVLGRLKIQFMERGLCLDTTEVHLCFACNNFSTKNDREQIKQLFEKNSWRLWDEEWLDEGLVSISKQGHEDRVSSIVCKMLLRRRGELGIKE